VSNNHIMRKKWAIAMKKIGAIDQFLRIYGQERIEEYYQKPEHGFLLHQEKKKMGSKKIDKNKERRSTYRRVDHD